MLKRTYKTLPSRYYFDPQHHETELELIWSREWICLAHSSEFSSTGAWRVYRIGHQQVVITRMQDGELNAFHNTCRHRGSQLCTGQSGRFSHGRVVCPYHGWAYSLDGALTHTPRRIVTDDFDPAEHHLYPVEIETWRGFIFINLSGTASGSLVSTVGEHAEALNNWPLEQLEVVHNEVHQLACNWKIFWENFSECLHCPVVHKDLCSVVPMYGEGFYSQNDLPEASPLKNARSNLSEGMQTWSEDGQTTLPHFESLTREERDIGMTFTEFLPGVFIVAHVDYVRSVHVLPLGPESTQLSVNWLLPSATIANGDIDIERLTRFARQVVLEDQQVCELNQAGLRCQSHAHGILTPQEYDVLWFNNWVRERLGEPPLD